VPKFGQPELQEQKAFFFTLLNNYTLWDVLEIYCNVQRYWVLGGGGGGGGVGGFIM
jgi:hypothetical protein